MIETSSKQWMLLVMTFLFLVGAIWMPIQIKPLGIGQVDEACFSGEIALLEAGSGEQKFRVGRGKARRLNEYSRIGQFET